MIGTCKAVGIAVNRDCRRGGVKDAYSSCESLSSLIRGAMKETGLGLRDPESPLRDILEPGMTVLLKPNWVLDRNEANLGMECMVTHHAFTVAAFREVLKTRPERVILGDAPIQQCQWRNLVTEDFQRGLEQEAQAANVQLDIVDFRRTAAITTDLADGVQTDRRPQDRYSLFDLAGDSLLEPISRPAGRFRVTCYDPRALAKTHRPGRHQYLVCRDVFEADAVFSLPKLKTHRKTGLTGALKNLVGINGSKDFLPHHRVGGTDHRGDCYPGRSLRKRWVEACLDMGNRRIGGRGYAFWMRQAMKHWRDVAIPAEGGLEGSWYGNDTCWRMVLDLNRILLYGRGDGSMSDTKQRDIYALTDAIVCGQGEGPLKPEPLVLGTVTFSDCAPASDMVHAALLGFDSRAIPLIRESMRGFRWPLCEPFDEPVVQCNGEQMGLDELARKYGVRAKAPVGWRGHMERVTES